MFDDDEGKVSIDDSKISISDIVFSQLNRITSLCNVEFRGGFYNRTVNKDGAEKLMYVPDSRAIVCNGILALSLIVAPSFKEKMRERYKKILQEIEELKKEFIEKSTVEETVILSETFYKNMKDKISLEEYKIKKLDKFLELFSLICKDMKANNYFQMQSGIFVS